MPLALVQTRADERIMVYFGQKPSFSFHIEVGLLWVCFFLFWSFLGEQTFTEVLDFKNKSSGGVENLFSHM